MINSLLLISFMLHIVALFAIYLLYKRLQTLQQRSHPDEVTDLLETYLQEIKEENKRLEQAMPENTRQEAGTVKADHDSNEQPAEQDMTNLYINPEDSIETSLQAKVLQLSREGLCADDIAKKLGCGKTEAVLMIKLHGKNEHNT